MKIEAIAESRWFKQKCREIGGSIDEGQEAPINPHTIEQTKALGFPLEVIKETIERKRQNQINVCLALLRDDSP